MSNSEIKNVLIAGGSGNLGIAILTELLATQKFKVFVLSREESKATFPPEVQVLKSAYTTDALTALLTSLSTPIDAVVSNLNGAEGIASSQLALINAAKIAGVKRFFPSEFGSDTSDEEVLKIVPVFRGKKAIVEYLRGKEDNGFSWTSLVTGAFLDWGLAHSFQGIDIKAKKFVKWDDGSVPFSATNLRTIGKAIANILSSSECFAATSNKYVFIASHTTTQNDLFEAVKRSLAEISGSGEGAWTVESVNADEATSKGLSAIAGGDFSVIHDLIRAACFGKRALNDYSKLGNNELLGLEKENFDVDVKRAVQEILSGKARGQDRDFEN